MDNIKFGKFIAELRKEKNMTQKQLAEKLNLTDKAISKWERGLSFPDITILNSLAEVLEVDISEILNGEKGKKEEIDLEKAIQDAIEQVNRTKEKRIARILKAKRITGIISIIIFILSVILQSVYLFLLKEHGFEYVIDSLFYIVNQAIIVCGALILVLYIKNSKIKNIIVWSICIILSIINIAFMINNGFDNKCIIDFSNDFSNQLVLKQDRKTGKTCFYRNSIILFAKPRENFSYAVDGKIKRKWLTNDICSITYKDESGALREFVATYGDRGTGNSYYYVAPAISGEWHVFTQNGSSTKIIVDSKGITVKKEGQTELFEYEDTKQFGTIALVLYNKEAPKYVIALNEECKLNEKTDIVEKGGTIILYKVSMDKTIAEILNCVTYKGNLNEEGYSLVNLDPYSYKIKNGILYIKYDEDIIEAPGEYSNMANDYTKYNYQISKEKTVFFYKKEDEIYLIYSDDMGKTWNETKLPNNASIENIQFLNSKVGFMLQFTDFAMSSATGKICKTTDGGKSWQVISHGIKDSQSYSFKKGSQIKFFNENLGFLIIPRNEYSCNLYITKDGGLNFEEVKVDFKDLNNKLEETNLEEIYDYYNLPTIDKGTLYVEINQGEDGDYNGGDSVTYYSNDNGTSWSLKLED